MYKYIISYIRQTKHNKHIHEHNLNVYIHYSQIKMHAVSGVAYATLGLPANNNNNDNHNNNNIIKH